MSQNVLSRRKQLFVEALAAGRGVAEAAAFAGVCRRQGTRYAQDPLVKAALAQAHDETLAQVTRRAASEAVGALDALAAILRDPTASASARVGAARVVLEMTLRFQETLDLAERISRLEEVINYGKE